MRKVKIVILMLSAMCLLGGCAEKQNITEEPDILQVRNICNLATLDCYYHNVAKSEKTAESGITHLGEKDRTFWIEYTGVAQLGIDMSKVEMTVDGENIEVTLPQAEVLSITIDNATLNEDSYITSKDGFNRNKIEASDQTAAINDAQKEMEETVMKNSTLLLNAQNRAKTLIENYIMQLGEAIGVQYNIEWNYVGAGQQNERELPTENTEEE